MKKYPMSIGLMFAYLSLVTFMSCEKESLKEEIIQPPFDINRKYLPVKVRANFPIDLNFDGIKNIDLTAEIDVFNDCFIYFTDEIITIAWPEAHVGDYPLLTSEIPTIYKGQDIKYFIIPKYYYRGWINNENDSISWIYLAEEIREEGQKNYFEYQHPDVLEINKKENTISFLLNNVWQNFMTKDDVKNRQFIAVFKPDPKDGYIQ